MSYYHPLMCYIISKIDIPLSLYFVNTEMIHSINFPDLFLQ